MKISIAEVKRRLPVGTEYVAEYIGNNAKFTPPGNIKTRRVVVTQGAEMSARFLEGPKKDHVTHLGWAGCSAEQNEDGSIVISHKTNMEAFLKITFDAPKKPLTLTIEIELENDVFTKQLVGKEDPNPELERIFRDLLTRLPEPLAKTTSKYSIHDINGNLVGTAVIE